MRALALVMVNGCLTLFAAPTLLAQDYAGTFSTPNQQGGVVTVLLRQSPEGEFTGRSWHALRARHG